MPECGIKHTELFSLWFEFLPYARCVALGKLLDLIKSYLPHLQNLSNFYQPPSRDWKKEQRPHDSMVHSQQRPEFSSGGHPR